jgi:hypothetical protein
VVSRSDVTGSGARPLGSLRGLPVGGEIVAMATAASPDPDGRDGGYWLAGSDGGVATYGTARFLGSAAGRRLQGAIVDIVGLPREFRGRDPGRVGGPVNGSVPTNEGYWLAGADGGVFSFGRAPFHGSAAGLRLQAPVVGMATTRSGSGYWLAAADGGVFAFGDARFAGSLVGRLPAPVVGIASQSGTGYTLATADGGIHVFGDDPFVGSGAGRFRRSDPVVAVEKWVGQSSEGYRIVSASGASIVFTGLGDFVQTVRGGTDRVLDVASEFGGDDGWVLVQRR